MKADLLTYFNDQTDTMVDLLSEVVAIESPTHDKSAVDRVGVRLIEELAKLEPDIEFHQRNEVGDIIAAHWNTNQGGKPIIAICHMDTVFQIGELERNPIRVEDGKLRGPGVVDEKGGIVTMISALQGLKALDLFPERPITVLLTSDEETGSGHSRDLIKEMAKEAELALIMEPAMPDGAVKTWRKSAAEFVVRAFGKAAHAGGNHESGLNAIEEIAHQTLALQRMTRYKVGTTVNVGVIKGGTVRNAIPDFCEIHIDARALVTEEMERLTEEIYNLKPVMPGSRLEIEGGFDRQPLERNALMIETFNRAQKIGEMYGLTIREDGTGGASDGNYTAEVGTPTLDGLGPVGGGMHSEREWCLIETLPKSATLVASLLLEWPAG